MTNGQVRMVGPYSGRLSDRCDRVAVERPQLPELLSDPVAWVIVDEVIYADQQPWPGNCDGTGRSLRRLLSWFGPVRTGRGQVYRGDRLRSGCGLGGMGGVLGRDDAASQDVCTTL